MLSRTRWLPVAAAVISLTFASCGDDGPAAPPGGGGGGNPISTKALPVSVAEPTMVKTVEQGYFGSSAAFGALVAGFDSLVIVNMASGKESPPAGLTLSPSPPPVSNKLLDGMQGSLPYAHPWASAATQLIVLGTAFSMIESGQSSPPRHDLLALHDPTGNLGLLGVFNRDSVAVAAAIGPVLDVASFGGADPATGLTLTTASGGSSTSAGTIVYDPALDDEFPLGSGTIVSSLDFPAPEPILYSTYAKDPGSFLVASTSLFGGQRVSSELWQYVVSGDSVRQVATLPLSAVRVRGAANVVAVTSVFSQTADSSVVSTFFWDTDDSVKPIDTLEFDDAYVSIEARQLGNGNVAFVTSGIFTYAVIVVSPTGATVSANVFNLPNDCQAVSTGFPGMASWVGDSGNHIVISCPDDSQVHIVTSGI